MTKGKTIGQRLKEIRIAAGMTQKQVAEGLGKDFRNMTHVESGKINPNIQYIIKWARVCGYAVEWNFVPKGEETEEFLIRRAK